MIKALRKRTRPDNLVNQVRAGGKNTARRVYLATVAAAAAFLVLQLVGPMIFLDADGLVMKERSVLAPEFNARVTQVHVRPGDHVRKGQLLLQVNSTETLDRIADLTSKLGTIAAREAQLAGRAQQASTLLPVAADRKARAHASHKQLQALANRGLTTSNRIMEATRELFDAEREDAQIRGESVTLLQELATTSATRKDLGTAIEELRRSYNGGNLVATVDGQVGPKVVSPGTILKLGEPALEIHSGESYVVAYLPMSRFYSLEAGDAVVITDGASRARGRVIRLEAMADSLPPEFQNVFSSRDRQQVVRIDLESGAERLSVQSKIKVVGFFSPNNAVSFVKSTISLATSTLVRLAGLEEGEGFVDTTAVGSLPKPKPPAPAFTLPPDDGPPDWRALSDRRRVNQWKPFE
jgi:multidrug resistance efflux pump